MTVEIERRFLLVDDSWREAASEPLVLQQGYLSVEKSAPSRADYRFASMADPERLYFRHDAQRV